MSIRRQTKVYINDRATEVGSAKYMEGTLSGYVQVITYPDPCVPDVPVVQQYMIKTTRPISSVLGDWEDAYLGYLKSFKKHYSNNYDGTVRVRSGNIVLPRDGECGPRVVACWMAAYDDTVLAFQVHWANGKCFQTNDIHISRNVHGQRETEYLPQIEKSSMDEYIRMSTDEYDPVLEVQQPVVDSSRVVRGSGRLSLLDQVQILELLRSKTKQSFIAKKYKVSAPYISKLKKQFIEDGRL